MSWLFFSTEDPGAGTFPPGFSFCSAQALAWQGRNPPTLPYQRHTSVPFPIQCEDADDVSMPIRLEIRPEGTGHTSRVSISSGDLEARECRTGFEITSSE
ncbi:MAG: hypothetical protein LBL59_02245 [Xanthomonadaceae bacterium]|jgi:hypothetical protein|nr:hypothetical protein [Xanthomonadaceae bacterium]